MSLYLKAVSSTQYIVTFLSTLNISVLSYKEYWVGWKIITCSLSLPEMQEILLALHCKNLLGLLEAKFTKLRGLRKTAVSRSFSFRSLHSTLWTSLQQLVKLPFNCSYNSTAPVASASSKLIWPLILCICSSVQILRQCFFPVILILWTRNVVNFQFIQYFSYYRESMMTSKLFNMKAETGNIQAMS